MAEPEGPQEDALSPMLQQAIALHTLFQSYVEGGFSEDQALRLIAYQLRRTQDPPRT